MKVERGQCVRAGDEQTKIRGRSHHEAVAELDDEPSDPSLRFMETEDAQGEKDQQARVGPENDPAPTKNGHATLRARYSAVTRKLCLRVPSRPNCDGRFRVVVGSPAFRSSRRLTSLPRTEPISRCRPG